MNTKCGFLLVGIGLLIFCAFAFVGTASAKMIYVPTDFSTIQTAVKTAKIDFEDQIRKYDYLMKFGQKEEAGKIVKNMNDKLNERFSGVEEIKIISSLLSGSFSIDTI